MTTPDPIPPSDGGLRSRHRPVLGDLAKDTTELDLWALDDDDMPMGDDLDPAPPVKLVPSRSEGQVPPRRENTGESPRKERFGKPKTDTASDVAAAQPAVRIQMNVGKIPQSRRGHGMSAGSGKPEADFDDLDQWDEDSGDEEPLELPRIEDVPADEVPVPVVHEPETTEEPEPPARQDVVAQATKPPAHETDEFSPPVRPSADPVSLRPHLRLSKFERIGMVALGVLLLGLGIGAYVFSVNRLPSQSLYTDDVKFPVKGTLVVVKGATSYWRAPILDSATPDVVRRGTVIIPVVEVSTTSGNGAMRAVFRDEARKTIGDSITHEVRGAGVVKFVSTAGFEDSGMHSAYRAGGGRPWTVEILEAPSTESPSTEFRRLFQINLSTETR